MYEFICQECQRAFEKFFFSQEKREKVVCPHCGSQKTERVFSTFSARSSGFSRLSSGCRNSGFS